MSKTSPESLASFLQRQQSPALCAILLELAATHDVVKQRLVRFQLADRPDKLASGFKKTLSAWRRSTKFHSYRESREYGAIFEAWLDQVARELAPKNPPAAVALFEGFIESDSVWFEHADDSDGSIGDVVRAACRHWLQAAALCETSEDVWPERLMKLYLGDEYGAREELLRKADKLLTEPLLRTLAAQFESRMAETLAEASIVSAPSYDVFKMSAALSLLSEALRDPDVKIQAVLRYSPDPNPVQRESFARVYLDVGRAEHALTWLQGSWGHLEGSRQSLQAEAFEKLGCFEDSLPIRQQMFEHSPTVFYLQQWLEHLPQVDQPAARARARQVALAHANVSAAAMLLMELGDAQAAESRLVAGLAHLDGANYPELVPLAKVLKAHECWRGETAVYRALLRGILQRGYARAYGHGSRYLTRLREIADSGVGLVPLQTHEAFEAEIGLRHGRKLAFWAHVNGKREAPSNEDDDLKQD